MPYQDSPGWERQWKNFSWDWDFHVSTVSEGHRVVNDKDKSDAKTKGAKLTFGEVLDCGVARMLHNLGAAHKTTFHDLGMGPGKMLIQTYLQFNNLRVCMGVELAKGRYDLGERNLRTLLKVGWRGRTFLGIEFKKGEFLKIVEDVPHKTPAKGWNIGDKVVAYYPLFKKDKMTVKNYHGVITNMKSNDDPKKNVYSIEYEDGTKCDRVQHRYLFIPGTERTCEVWFGSLFDYPGGFDAELCVLETDFPEEMHPHLIEMMCSTPYGCTFLTYHDLKKFKCFDWKQLRQIDCNIYDNDRYITSWSQGWRFYLWEHIPHFTDSLHYEQIEKIATDLHESDQILFKDKNDDVLQYGEVLTISGSTQEEVKQSEDVQLIVRTNRIESKKVHYQNVTLSSNDFNIYKTRHRFRIGQEVSAYYPENLKESQYQLRYEIYRGKVIAVNAHSLSYVLKYVDEGTTRLSVSEQHVYKRPELLFKPGENVMSCWPRNAQNKNSPHRYKRFPAEVIERNTDSTYKLRFKVSPYLLSLLRPQTFPEDYDVPADDTNKKGSRYAPAYDQCYAENVREMWIQYPAQFVVDEIEELEERLGPPFYTQYRAELCGNWSTKKVISWLEDIGLGEHQTLVQLVQLNKINGKHLLQIESQNDKELRAELKKLFVKREEEERTNDGKTESIDFENEDGLDLNRIELRNLWANIKHLKQQHQMYESQYKNEQGAGHKDYAKLQQVWQNFRKEIRTGGGGAAAVAPIEDTDTK
eukprot:12497_1